MSEYLPEGRLSADPSNLHKMSSPKLLHEAAQTGDVLEARAVMCDAAHNLTVDLGCMRGVAIISRVNRPVCFTVTGFRTDRSGAEYAVLSRENAQKKCMESFISSLRKGDVVDAKITHLESFGAFADIGCGIVALMPIDAISVSRIEHPKERFSVGMDIRAVVRSKENGRISLSHKELLGTWEQNAARFRAGETVSGIVRSVEHYGAFVELAPNLAGLAESRDGVEAGQQASVYIKSIIPEKMKIKLIIIDTFDYKYNPKPPEYFCKERHIDRFLYSPEGCKKHVESVFD